jgi:hypothetical protein
MSDVIRTLPSLSTGFAVFEPDQVLTPGQLNSVGTWLDAQTRLTRVRLLGVGIACGLQVSRRGDSVVLSPGTGVTTDGDLVHVERDLVFDQFKARGENAPVYAPLLVDGQRIPVFELLAADTTGDPDAAPLSSFAAAAGAALDAFAAVLLVESHIEDHDLCTGTDCDNRGKECDHPLKLLAVPRDAAARLARGITSPRDAASGLAELAADRAITAAGITSTAVLRDTMLAACDRILKKFAGQADDLARLATTHLDGAITPNEPAAWVQRLSALRGRFADGAAGLQYFYALLKDLADTWNAMLGHLAEDDSVCRPDLDAFPKHLVAGPLDGTTDGALRTGFCPAVANAHSDALEHARFLARKLGALIEAFDTGAPTSGVRITPSAFEDEPLEERAIPVYYRIRGEQPIHRAWNFRLNRRGRDTACLGYRAPEYGGPSQPCSTQIGRYPFFRVEGHLGLNIATALERVQAAIRDCHVPIAVETVLLASDRRGVVRKPGFRFTDLHRLHTLVRKDVSMQLDNVAAFSGSFKTQVEQAVDANVIVETAASQGGLDLKRAAAEKHTAVSSATTQAKAKIDRSYSAYKSDLSWKGDIATAMQSGGEFKRQLTGVSKTEFVTPVDTLIGTTHVHWLDWLDDLIKDREDKQDDRQLFATFARKHPGLEHFGGALRGGTFVLAYDSSGVVVADFALPYWVDDDVEETEPEPPLRTPEVKSPWIIANGINLIRPLDTVITSAVAGKFKEIEPKINLQKDYFTVVKDSMTLINDAYTRFSAPAMKAGVTGFDVNDAVLGAFLNETAAKQKAVEVVREKMLDPATPAADREKFGAQQKVLENELAASITKTVTYVAESGTPVAAGSDSLKAIQNLSRSSTAIADAAAIKAVNTALTNTMSRTNDAGLKVALGGMVRGG